MHPSWFWPTTGAIQLELNPEIGYTLARSQIFLQKARFVGVMMQPLPLTAGCYLRSPAATA
jgi:hypothetical protein